MAIEEKGSRSEERVVVFVHGVLANRSTWRFIVGDLGCDHSILLVDLPGSGASDKPNPAVVGEGFYAPDSLAQMTLEFQGQGAIDGPREFVEAEEGLGEQGEQRPPVHPHQPQQGKYEQQGEPHPGTVMQRPGDAVDGPAGGRVGRHDGGEPGARRPPAPLSSGYLPPMTATDAVTHS